MPDETAVVETTVEAPKMFGDDGNFTENWTQSLKDESLHDNETLKTATSIESLATMTVSAQKMIGADKITILNDASTETEIDAWHKAGGRPDTAADYNITRPEDFPEELWSQDQANAAQELFHKAGFSQKQVDAINDFNNSNILAKLKQTAQDDKLELQTLEDSLYSDWGNAFEQKKHLANIAVEEAAGEDQEFKERLLAKYTKDPDIVRAFANLGSKFSEGKRPDVTLIPTTGDIQKQIDEATAHKSHGADYKEHGFTKSQHEAQVSKVTLLYKSMYPEKK